MYELLHPIALSLSLSPTRTQEASRCLQEHSQMVRNENHRLREELRRLIDTSGELQTLRTRLETQYQTLLRGCGRGAARTMTS